MTDTIKRNTSLALALFTFIGCAKEVSSIKAKKGQRKNPKAAIIESEILDSDTLKKDLKENPFKDWQHKDLKLDEMYGVSSELAYKDLALTQKREVIVAVIDSGVDHQHPDLKDVMWINEKEIPGNGIDDDNNGYIDDIYGWNFIGGVDGKHINEETLEQTRIYKKFLDRLASGEVLAESERALFTEVRDLVEIELSESKKNLKEAKRDQVALNNYMQVVTAKTGIEEFKTRAEIEALDSSDAELKNIKEALLELWDGYWRGFSGIDRAIENNSYYVNYGLNINYNGREEIVGDDPSDFTDTNYGNNDVIGPDASHGTHVAGIIAASRKNLIGMDGIAANVKIMALRAVPNGDERDKDIALAVRYAADNGAHIINMSFGKAYSPYKAEVDAAFEYAASKGVLLVHAAGNSAKNIDGGKNNFPNSYKMASVWRVNSIPNWIEVAANTKDLGLNLPASFTNYGEEAATLFAPGRSIYSTIPGNAYAAFSGTSMACPVVAGVASLLMSEFPTMTSSEARAILLETVSKPEGLKVRLPEQMTRTPDFRLPVPFAKLSKTGGVINAFTAIELAIQLAQD